MLAGRQISKYLSLWYRLDTGSDIFRNRFESLLEQAIQDDLEADPVQPTKSTVPPTAETTTELGQKYHMEVQDSQENALMVFTLFADLHDIKAEMKSLWKRCFRDGADPVVATLLTAQTIAFVEGLEERVMSVLGPSKYQHGGAPDKGNQQNGPWSFRGTYCRLLEALRDPNDAQAIIRFEDSNHTSGNRGKPVNMNTLTFAFTAQRLNRLRGGPCGDPTDDPTDEFFGPYCEPLLLYFEHNPRGLLNDELGAAVVKRDQNLCCLFAEMAYLDCSSPWQGARRDRSERARRIQSVRKDPIMSSLQPVWTRQEVNLTSVFAAEIMLDIKELSDKFPAGRPSYHATFDKYSTLLGLQADISSVAKPAWSTTRDNPFVLGGNTPAWDSKVKVATDKILSMLSIPNPDGGDRPSEQEERREPSREAWDIYRELDTLRLKCTEPEYWDSEFFHFFWLPRDAHFFFDHFTMFGTHREAFMQALTESIGIDILNHGDRQGLGVMAHVFNASRQLGLGNLHWPAMDRLIELHKVALFAGDPPTTPADMLKRFSHRHMGPKRAMSRKQREKIMSRDVTQMKPSAITQALNEHWDTCGRIPFWYTLEVNALAEASEKKGAKNDTPTTKQMFVENLPAIDEYLVKQLRDVRVDYLEIARVNAEFNKNLLKHARKVFEKQPNRLLNKEEVDHWSGIDFVSEAFEQEPELHEAMAKCRGGPSKMPIQDCDYLQDSIDSLASTLRARGIGLGQTAAADGEGVNMPTSLTRFKIRGSEDLPDLGRLVLVHRCACCHRKQYV